MGRLVRSSPPRSTRGERNRQSRHGADGFDLVPNPPLSGRIRYELRSGTNCRQIGDPVQLMELKEKTTLSREEAAARLHAIADELASGNDVIIERENLRFVAHVPDQVELKVEFEIEDDGTELEIELTWKT